MAQVINAHIVAPQAEPKRRINWQPIETAPKDNKRPLLLASFDNRGVLSNVDFNGSWECESESWEMPQEYYFWNSANGMADEPTHWAYQPEGFAQLTKETAVPQAEPKREDQPVRDLLAIIHCDGGHHTEAVGIEQSIKDALSAVCVLKGKLAQAEPKREPLSDERIDTALQTDPVLITRLMIGSMTVGEFRAALRRLARIVERALEIGGSDAE
jgi:hypothetical protein